MNVNDKLEHIYLETYGFDLMCPVHFSQNKCVSNDHLSAFNEFDFQHTRITRQAPHERFRLLLWTQNEPTKIKAAPDQNHTGQDLNPTPPVNWP